METIRPAPNIDEDPDAFIGWLMDLPDEILMGTYQKFLKDERFFPNKGER